MTLNDYYVDLHIHIGAGSNGQPVKITASRKLNFANIAEEALLKKGLNMIGVID
jgi:PHP family Zn ribbon phosphoesterase